MKKTLAFLLLLFMTTQTVAYGYNVVNHGITNTQYGYVNAYDRSTRVYTEFVLENMYGAGVAAVRSNAASKWVTKSVTGSLRPGDYPKSVLVSTVKSSGHQHAYAERLIAR